MSIDTLQNRTALLMDALQPDGLYGGIAQELVEPGAVLESPADVIEVLNLRKQGSESEPRWSLQEDAPEAKKAAAARHGEAIMVLAHRIGTAAPETLTHARLAQIDPKLAVAIGEGGANGALARTAVLEGAMAIRGVERQTINQLGDKRVIEPIYKGKPNAEHTKVRGFAPDFAAEGPQTEYANTIAVARQDGFDTGSWNHTVLPNGLAVVTSLIKGGRPNRNLILPTVEGEKGLKAGLTVVHSMVGLNDEQPFIGTNAQFELKDQIMADQWAKEHGVEFGAEPVVIGDQPGWVTRFNGRDIVTADRAPLIHMNEAVIAGRLLLAAA